MIHSRVNYKALPVALLFIFVILITTGCESPSSSTTELKEGIIDANTRIITTESGLKIKVTDLGTLGGKVSRAWAINNKGQIVGGATTGTKGTHAFLWQAGEMTDLDKFGGSEAYTINDNEEILGMSRTDTAVNYIPVLWQKDKISDICNLGSYSLASSINNQGDIVGVLPSHNIFLLQNGTLTDLGIESALGTENPPIINNKGQITYTEIYWKPTCCGPTEHAILWENGKKTDLGSLEGRDGFSVALSINDQGQVVGISEDRGFLWEDGKMTDLGTGTIGYAHDINEKGQIVGQHEIESGERHVFLWENGILTDLGPGIGYSINENRQIVGWKEVFDQQDNRYYDRATLWEIME